MKSDLNIIRQSNIELLRIIAMSMIIILHYFTHVISKLEEYENISFICKPIFIYGVNVFFIISGFFKTKLNLKTLLGLILVVLFFNLENILLLILFGQEINFIVIFNSVFFPITHSYYWFVKVYLFIIILSPIINLTEFIPEKKLFIISLIFLIFTLYSCGIGHNEVNPSGYTFLQGILMYILGIQLSIFAKKKTFIKYKSSILILFIITTIIASLLNYLFKGRYFEQYNSITSIFGSIFLFIIFQTKTIRSNIINIIAKISFGCYLLQDGIFGYKFLYNKLISLMIYLNTFNFIILLLIVFILFWIFSFFFTTVNDKIVYYFMSKISIFYIKLKKLISNNSWGL